MCMHGAFSVEAYRFGQYQTLGPLDAGCFIAASFSVINPIVRNFIALPVDYTNRPPVL